MERVAGGKATMPASDVLISLREKTLDAVSGSDGARSLNPSASPAGPLAAPGASPRHEDPAGEILGLLRQVFASGLADHGESVDYAALHGSPLFHEFRRCAANLRAFDPAALPDRDARLAFWINLYNTLVLDGVIALGVQRSVMERRAGLAFFRQAAYVVGGLRVSCDDIEHGILRANRGHPYFPGKQFGSPDPRLAWVIQPMEARIHFALNCASGSCPPLRAYAPEKLGSQLDLAARNFLAADVQILPDARALRLSAIFKWFAEDFGGRQGVIDFLLAHLPQGEDLRWLSGHRDRVSLRYKPYDWGLNSKDSP